VEAKKTTKQKPILATINSSNEGLGRDTYDWAAKDPKTDEGIAKPQGKLLATLTVESSDDPQHIHKVFEIRNNITRVGRGAVNEMRLSEEDKVVSREHIIITRKAGSFFLEEATKPKRPTYGTFVDEIQVNPPGIILQNAAIIRLGSRFRMRFEIPGDGDNSDKTDN
jgi:pSer/pThr/pTyr-binding forkhead associated (FHA) protein